MVDVKKVVENLNAHAAGAKEVGFPHDKDFTDAARLIEVLAAEVEALRDMYPTHRVEFLEFGHPESCCDIKDTRAATDAIIKEINKC